MIFKIILAIIIAGSSLIAAPASATSSYSSTYTQSYFESFDADYYLEKDEQGASVMRVVEKITAIFPADSEEHGITRQLIYTGPTDLSDNKTLTITATRNGQPENIAQIVHVATHKSYSGNSEVPAYFDLRVGNANTTVSGRQVYTLEYTYYNVIDEDADDIQELYWNANGTGWTKTIKSLTARVHFGEGIAKGFTGDVACFVGKYGETGTDRCEISKISDGVEFATTGKSLSASENLTFALGFKPNTFKIEPDGYALQTKQYLDYRHITMLIIAVVTGAIFIIIAIIAYRSASEKRKYYKSYFVKPEYTPPHDLLVADMAENYIGSASGNKQVATLMQLAVNHQIEMIKTEKDGMFGKKNTVWKIKVTTDNLKKEQAIVLKILAGSDTPLHKGQEIIVKSHTATSELTKLAADFTETIKKRLISAGLLEGEANDTDDSEKTSTTKKTKKKIQLAQVCSVLVAVWVILWVIAIGFAFDDDNLPNYLIMPSAGVYIPLLILVVLGVAITVTVLCVKTSNLSKHTMKGLEYSRYMDGLKMYIKMAEADRLKFLQSVDGADTTNQGIVKLYEKLLPYAVVFRMEKSWLDELSRYYELEDVAAPVWYVGIGAFSARDFSSAMSSISSSASSAIISSSSTSSSGGGFGGGGFSGGGGGGGGGGTW